MCHIRESSSLYHIVVSPALHVYSQRSMFHFGYGILSVVMQYFYSNVYCSKQIYKQKNLTKLYTTIHTILI